MIADIAINLAVALGLGLTAYALYAFTRTSFLNYRNRKDAGPLRASLQKMGENVKVRNRKVSARNIEDTFD